MFENTKRNKTAVFFIVFSEGYVKCKIGITQKFPLTFLLPKSLVLKTFQPMNISVLYSMK